MQQIKNNIDGQNVTSNEMTRESKYWEGKFAFCEL
jgi:hypothetical protein